MLVQTNHFSFIIDRAENETVTSHRAVIQRVRQRVDSLPKMYCTHADIVKLIEMVRLEIRRAELELDKGYDSIETRHARGHNPPTTGTIRIKKGT